MAGLLMAEADQMAVPACHSAEEILSHPRFPFARDEFLKAILALYEHNPFLNRLLLEAGRTVLFVIIICLHARYDEADRETWPTLRLVTQSMMAHGLASARRVSDLVARLIKTGYLEQRGATRAIEDAHAPQMALEAAVRHERGQRALFEDRRLAVGKRFRRKHDFT